MDQIRQASVSQPEEIITVYQDECSFYRQPTQGWLWHSMGRRQPKMRWSNKANTLVRVAGALNPVSGQLHYLMAPKIRTTVLSRFLLGLAKEYPRAKRIYVVMDNWPVHFNPKVLEKLKADPRIELVRLPTYAPWLNPIEKLWRLLRQKLTHAHPYCDDFDLFKVRIQELLATLPNENALLQYVGLAA